MDRKQFIQNSILGTVGFSTVGIKTWAAPIKPSVIDNNVPQIKITDVKTYLHNKALFVQVTSDAGISGWGEADHDNTTTVVKAIHKVYKKHVIGENPFDSEYIWHQCMYIGEDLGLSGLSTGALAGIDNAIWDLKGKITNLPVYQLLGGTKIDKVKVYGSFGIGEGDAKMTPEKAAKTASDFVALGYDTVKVRIQIRHLNRNPEPDQTEAYVKAVREAIGDNVTLFVDFNNGYTAGKAVELILRLYEKYNIALVEEPVHYKDYDGLRQCVEASPIRIAAGEHDFNRYDFRDLITRGKADVCNLDVIKGGGISEMKKASVLVQAFDKEVMFHNARPSLACAATLQLVASIFNAARVQEYGGKREKYKLDQYFENTIEFNNGYLTVPKIPGIGLTVNEKAIAKLLVD